jgi:hypothetical protein
MDAVTAVSVAAFGISLLTFLATQFGMKRSASSDYVINLERRVELQHDKIEDQDKEITALKTRVRMLEDERIVLLERIVRGQNGRQ